MQLTQALQRKPVEQGDKPQGEVVDRVGGHECSFFDAAGDDRGEVLTPREILPRLGRRESYRLARFDPVTGELDLDHLASLVDARTKLVCCTGASNFLGTRTPLAAVRAMADASGYVQPDGERRSYLLVDGAQLVPGSFVDVHALGADFLAFSFHKLLAPFGVGVLYARRHLLESSLPFLYGGDMIAEGRVLPDLVEYNALP